MSLCYTIPASRYPQNNVCSLYDTKHYPVGGARGVMVIVAGYGHGTRVQILDLTDCISHSTWERYESK